MPGNRTPRPNDLTALETWLAERLTPVEADDTFVEHVQRRLTVQDPRPMEIAWRPPAARQHMLVGLAAIGGPLLTLALAMLFWFYRRGTSSRAATT